MSGDFTLSSNRVLTIRANQPSSEGLVTLTARDNAVDGPESKEVTVSGTTTNALVSAPDTVALTITDDERYARGDGHAGPKLTVNEGASNTYTVVLDLTADGGGDGDGDAADEPGCHRGPDRAGVSAGTLEHGPDSDGHGSGRDQSQ